jgi:hypothetical protein
MNLFQILWFAAFTSLPVSHTLLSPSDCNDITASVKISEEEPSGSKVTLTIERGTAPFKYIFYKESGELLSEKFDSNMISVPVKGKYFCTVIDKRYCKKTIEFDIK